LRSLQEIQPDFEEQSKAYAGLWCQGKKKKKKKKKKLGSQWTYIAFALNYSIRNFVRTICYHQIYLDTVLECTFKNVSVLM
jgi:hypothetical protein